MKPLQAAISLCFTVLLTLGPRAWGQHYMLTVSDATGPRHNRVVVLIGHKQTVVPIPPGTRAGAKRDMIWDRLRMHGYQVADDGPGGRNLMVLNVGPQEPLALLLHGTGEVADRIAAPMPQAGVMQFAGVFYPFDSRRQPALFTAGIVTDVGELVAQISSQELNFQTDGPIICQALFQRLAPRAPQYGAQINYAGDRLEIYFDPAYTGTQGGIIFGTNSLGEGCSGTLGTTAPPTDKKKHCLIVTAPTDSTVTIQYLAPNGQWMPFRSKHFGAKDKKWEVCDLVVGKKYRIIGRKQGDNNEGNWTEFTFQPDPGSDDMRINVTIKM